MSTEFFVDFLVCIRTNHVLMRAQTGLTNEIDDLKAQVKMLSGEVDRFT